jgi:TetR/AcrR family transcriptional repressor of nem operon
MAPSELRGILIGAWRLVSYQAADVETGDIIEPYEDRRLGWTETQAEPPRAGPVLGCPPHRHPRLGASRTLRRATVTHGGFYKHFASRDDLIAQAAARALTEGLAKMENAARKNEDAPRSGLIDAYLATQHRDSPGTGCALVTLGAAAGRGDQEFKEAYEKQVRSYLDLITGLHDHPEGSRDEAMLTLSALVGAVLISRAVADKDLSDELLEAVNQQLKLL